MFRAIIITLIAFFCLCSEAYSAELSATTLAEKAVKYSIEGPKTVQNRPKVIKDYIELSDLIIGTYNDDLNPIIDANQSLSKEHLDLFRSFNAAQNISTDEFRNDDNYNHLVTAASDGNEHVAYISNFLLSVLHLRQYDRINGLLFAEKSTRLATNFSDESWRQVYLHDSYAMAFMGLVLDLNEDMALQTLERLITISEEGQRSLDGFVIVNNLAMLYHNLSAEEKALQILRSVSEDVSYANDENIAIYHYTTGVLELKNKLYEESVRSLHLASQFNTNPHIAPRINGHLSLGYARLKNNEMSQVFLDKMLNASNEEQAIKSSGARVLLIKSLIAENNGQSNEALKFFKEWSQLRDQSYGKALSKDRKESSEKIARTQKFINAELERVRRENELNDIILEETQEKVRLRNVILFLLAMSTLVVGYLAYRLYLSRREAEYSRDQAIASEQVKTNILAAMSHEFRTPLNAIIPLSELLGNQLNNPDIRAKLSLIKNAGLSLLSMVDNLCTIANPSNDSTIYAEEFDFNEFALKIIADWNIEFKRKNILLKAQSRKSSNNRFNVSKNATKMILENLISNALKFTNSGHVTVAFYEDKNEQGRSLIIEVTDTGIGIDHKKLPGYLEPFSQEDMGLSRSYQGLGIGLAAVNSIVKTCNGTISVSSNLPVGTSVRVSIPENHKVEDVTLLAA